MLDETQWCASKSISGSTPGCSLNRVEANAKTTHVHLSLETLPETFRETNRTVVLWVDEAGRTLPLKSAEGMG